MLDTCPKDSAIFSMSSALNGDGKNPVGVQPVCAAVWVVVLSGCVCLAGRNSGIDRSCRDGRTRRKIELPVMCRRLQLTNSELITLLERFSSRCRPHDFGPRRKVRMRGKVKKAVPEGRHCRNGRCSIERSPVRKCLLGRKMVQELRKVSARPAANRQSAHSQSLVIAHSQSLVPCAPTAP
jgi:hypothetical protein